ncbi:MAG: ABC transporter ATP-binding protein [Propionibacteriaceae bacterium]|nr:ABC transporter ATP-binding protein [Propionibacteriaceae bacterium]
MILAEDVRFAYGANPVLAGVSLSAPAGRVVGLIGPNGSGKTTLLGALYAALDARGRIELDGDPVGELGAREVARRVAVVVQEHAGDLPLRVSDMVLLGRLPHRATFSRTTGDDDAIAAAALTQVGAVHLADREFAALSGGEKQRVLIARALTQQATHLLLDEPTNHLDIRYAHEILDLVRRLTLTASTSAVVVLHDLNLAARYCDDLILLDSGTVAVAGPVDAVLQPEHVARVYGVTVRRFDLDGDIHLSFSPRTEHR